MGLLIIGNLRGFFLNGSHNLSATLTIFRYNIDISVIHRRYDLIFLFFLLNRLSMPDIVSGLTNIRNIDDVSRHFKSQL